MQAVLDRLTYHAVFDADVVDALRFAQHGGLAGIQLAVEPPHLSFDRIGSDERRRIASFRAEHNLRISLHGHDGTTFFEPNRYLRDGLFAYLAALLDFADEIGCGLITLHMGGPALYGQDGSPLTTADSDRQLYMASAAENLQRLARLLHGRPQRVCFENAGMGPVQMEALQPLLDSGQLDLCWDIAKTFSSQLRLNEPVYEFFRANLSHVRHVHLHDIRDGAGHRVVGSGGIDFLPFLSMLAAAPVEEYAIEVRPPQAALASRDNLVRILQRPAVAAAPGGDCHRGAAGLNGAYKAVQ
jgi:sugar phosphate isomerase/epimerase